MKKKTINIGVVGCGYWGPNLIRNFRALQDCRMKVICDQDVNRLKQLKNLYPEVQTETSFEKLLGDKSIDAVIVATPVRFHYKMAKAALEALSNIDLVSVSLLGTTYTITFQGANAGTDVGQLTGNASGLTARPW